MFKSAPFLPDTLQTATWMDSESHDWYDAVHDAVHDCEGKWEIINEFLVHSLKSTGAQWGQGPQTRGTEPVFVAKRVVPKQHKNQLPCTNLLVDCRSCSVASPENQGAHKTVSIPNRLLFVLLRVFKSARLQCRGFRLQIRLLPMFFLLDDGPKRPHRYLIHRYG